LAFGDSGENLKSKSIDNCGMEKAGLIQLCLFYLFPSVIINSKINLALQVSRCYT